MIKQKVIVVVGPTASGKTSFAIELAKKLDGEIVSADSMQIYEKMQIATAKPTKDELSQVKHHMIGFAKLEDEFSVAKYKQMAMAHIDDILQRGKTPIVVGGTGLYVDTLVKNTEFFEYEQSQIRQNLEKRLELEGIERLFEQLQKVDVQTAEKLHLNDTKRIIRALEVYYTTGKTITNQRENSHLNESKYDFCIFGLNAENRQYLYDRINLRVDLMLEEGLIDEAKEFFAQDKLGTLKQAIGYKELKPYFDGELSLEIAIENLKMQTRRYAKRQLTWFRKNESIHWLLIDEHSKDELLELALKII